MKNKIKQIKLFLSPNKRNAVSPGEEGSLLIVFRIIDHQHIIQALHVTENMIHIFVCV